MLDELLEVGTKLFEVSDRLQQAGEKRRKCIADYFLNIEECLRDSVEQLKIGQVPNSKWGELKVYARKLPSTVGQEIGRETAEELSLLLLSTAKSIPTDRDIPSIEAAAGKFKGLANTITTKQSGSNSARRRILTYAAVGTTGFIGGLALNHLRSGTSPIKNILGGESPKVDNKFPRISWKMPTFLGESVSKTILYSAPYEVCRRIKEMTDDRFLIEVKPTGDTSAILDMVSRGDVPCGYAGIYYGAARYSLFFSCAIPFGLTSQEQNAWLDYKESSTDDFTFVQSIYKKLGLNVISFPAGGTGAQAGGWFNKKIESVNDFRNLKMRTIGMGGEILKRYFGVITLEDLARGENRPNIPMGTSKN